MNNQKLIFVYNADSSLEHQLFDFLHKAISPSTYQCSLCAITYGTFTMRKEWRAFISALPMPVEFLYRNQFRRYYKGYRESFPAVLLQKEGALKVIVTPREMDTLDLPALKDLLAQRVGVKP